MAHQQQLPLNSLIARGGGGGNNSHHHIDSAAATTSNNNSGGGNFQVHNQEITFSELHAVSGTHCRESNFHEYAPPPHYQEHMNGQFDRQFLSSSAELSTSSVSGSLPPITSFGIHKSTTMGQPESIGTLIRPSTSISPLSCSTSQTSSYNQRNHHQLSNKVQSEQQWKHSPTTINKSRNLVQQQQHPHQQQFNCHTNSLGPNQIENYYQQQQMSSPAYSIHQANSISNPASIISATPDSPSSTIRPPSVRSNYSLRFVNSTPDPTTTIIHNNNDTNEQLNLSDNNQLQDGMVQRFIGETPNHFYQEQPKAASGGGQIIANLKQTKRAYTVRGQTQKLKTPMLPLVQFETSPNVANYSAGVDGLTVREHLQQQQAAQKQRLQQELMIKRLRKEEAQIGMNNGLGNAEDNKFQIESAPPSVAPDTSISSSSLGSSPTMNYNNPSKLQRITILTTTPVHQLLKAESLSPPKRNTTNRSRTGAQTQKRLAASIVTTSVPSSSEALASTIASVASGGGSLEEFEKLSSGPNPPASNATPACSPSTSLLSHSLSPHRLTSPKNTETSLTIKSNSLSNNKRRKIMTPNLSAINKGVLPANNNSTIRSFDVGGGEQHLLEKPVEPLVLYQPIQDLSPTKHAQKQQQQRCRIHVQNPPQTHGDFPMTGTKIQVVHMQPSPTAATISTNVSPKPDYVARSLLSSKSSNDNFVSLQPNQQQQSPFSAPLSSASSEMVVHDVGGMLYSPKGGGVVTPLMAGHSPASPFHAAPPQPRKLLLPASAAPKPGTPVEVQQQHHQRTTENIVFQQQQQFVPSDNQEESTSAEAAIAISFPQQQQIFNHNTSIIQNRPIPQQQQQPHKYPSPLRHQPQQPAPPPNEVSYGGQIVVGPSPSPHQQQQHIPYSPLNMAGAVVAAPPAVPLQQMQISRFQQHHHQQQQQSQAQQLQQQQSEFTLDSPHLTLHKTSLQQQHPMPSAAAVVHHYSHPQQQQQLIIEQQNPAGPLPAEQQQQQQIPYQQQQQQLLQQQQIRQQQQRQQQQLYPHPMCTSPNMAATAPPYSSNNVVLAQQQQLQRPLSPKSYSSSSKQFRHGQQQQQRMMIDASSIQHHSSTTNANLYQKTTQKKQQQQPEDVQPGLLLAESMAASSSSSSSCVQPQNTLVDPQSQPSAQQPPRAQLSRAQLLARYEQENYAVKLYHLQRTIKALVYKNGALADELARLNQRIHVVTEERRVLAKRLQHHERNKIRRLQAQFRKTVAASAAAKEEQQQQATEQLQPVVQTKVEIDAADAQIQEMADIKNCTGKEVDMKWTGSSTTTTTMVDGGAIIGKTKKELVEETSSPPMEMEIDGGGNTVFCEEKSLLVNS